MMMMQRQKSLVRLAQCASSKQTTKTVPMAATNKNKQKKNIQKENHVSAGDEMVIQKAAGQHSRKV